MRASGYCRVSTAEQSEEGYSLDAQEQAIRAYCQAQSWELTELYVDAGRSGGSLKGREELARLLDDAESGQFERVVFWRLDRLGRNLRDLLDLSDRLEAAGVGLVSIQEAIDTGTPGGRMVRNVLGSLAEFEREITVERIKAGVAAKARAGHLVGPLPLGYVRDESGAVAIDPATAPLVEESFEHYSTGQYSLRELAHWAEHAGLRSTEGNLLDRLSLRKILRNPTYVGKVTLHQRRGGGVVAKGEHPALIAEDVFADVQRELTRRRRGGASRPYGREPYPLSGIATCSACGSGMLGSARVVAGKYRYRHMRCSTSQRRGREACTQPMVRAEALEGHMAAYLAGMRLPPEYLGAVVQELRQRRRSDPDPKELQRLERELERWRRLFVLGDIEEGRYRQETVTIRQRIRDFEESPEPLDIERAISYLRDVGRLWADSPRSVQREFIREVFQHISVNGHEIASITPTVLYAPLFVIDRYERFGGEFVQLAPRVGLEPTT